MTVRVAVQISGQPRFTKDLTDFIHNLQGDYVADWFFCLWKNNPLPDKYGEPEWRLIHDSWREPQLERAQQCILRNLPQNHRLVQLVIDSCDQNLAPQFHNVQHVPNVQQVWNMWYGWKRANELRIQQEAIDGNYDLVIRMRGDCGLQSPVNVQSIARGITVSKDHWHGFERKINDLFAFGDRDSITEYCNIIDHAVEHNKNCTFHSETMLAYHLEKRNVPIHKAGWGHSFRTWQQGQRGQCDWGSWICEL